jgi:serine/threonine protein kinase
MLVVGVVALLLRQRKRGGKGGHALLERLLVHESVPGECQDAPREWPSSGGCATAISVVPVEPHGGGGGGGSSGGGGGGSGSSSRRTRARDFALVELEAATSSFAKEHLLAEGAYGAVYRGKLRPSGTAVAIKVLTKKDDPAAKASQYSGQNSFALEAKVLGQYRHINIVRLLGQCIGDAQPQQYLVYDYMPGGSLYDRLGPDSAAAPLTWQERHTIASDAARGLEYLHVDADPPIIHQDIKSDNILLGEYNGQLVAKIADFGAVRIAPTLLITNVSHYTAREVIGTKPYQPPEYAMSGHVSEKTDTFAFGVVLLELLTAKPPSDEASNEFLYSELEPVLSEAEMALVPLLDRSAGEWPLEKALAMAAIAKKCLEMFPRRRTTVREVLVELDVLAGRQAIRRAGRGEEYDTMTGELVPKKSALTLGNDEEEEAMRNKLRAVADCDSSTHSSAAAMGAGVCDERVATTGTDRRTAKAVAKAAKAVAKAARKAEKQAAKAKAKAKA